MTKINKILFTIVLTAFVAFSTCLIASAQAPNVEINQSTDYDRLFATVYDEQTTDVVMLFYSNIDKSTLSTDTYCVLTENYYDNYFGGDIYDITISRFEIVVQTNYGATGGGPSKYYLDTLLNAFNAFYNFYLTPDGVPVSPFTDQHIITSIVYAEQNQFFYWDNKIQNAKDVAFDNGFAEGQQTGLQVGYGNGYNDGYNDAISDSDAYLEGLFAVFDAPFVFLENLSSFSIFGITIIDVVTFLLIICFALFIYKVIRRFLPI